MSYGSEWEVKKKTGMGQQVGALEKFKDLQETACVHVQQRELVAWCRVFPLICPEEKDFNKILEERFIPALIKVGRGRWYRDVLTDLSLALSVRGDTRQKQDAKDVLREE